MQDSLVSLFSDKICELADIHKLEVNIYSLGGHLLDCPTPNWSGIFSAEHFERSFSNRLRKPGSYLLGSTNEEGAAYLSSFDYTTNERGHPVALVSRPFEEVDTSVLCGSF